MTKKERLEDERDDEREEGLSPARRGSAAAPSDQPETEPPHPRAVSEIGRTG
jgi:hypothetical protein